jgi:hypothetical protein
LGSFLLEEEIGIIQYRDFLHREVISRRRQQKDEREDPKEQNGGMHVV